MSKSQSFALALLKHYFQNLSIPNVGDATGLPAAATVGSLYVALHTADPGKTGDQTTSEATYTGYARVAVARTNVAWTCAGTPIPTAQNASTISFAPCTGGSNVIGWFSIGVASAGASQIGYSGQLSTVLFDATAKASTDIITIPGHTFVVSDTLVFSVDNGEAIPAGITPGTIYFVKTVSGNDITISATNGGATLDITSDSVCTVGKIATLSVSNGITPTIAANGLVFSED